MMKQINGWTYSDAIWANGQAASHGHLTVHGSIDHSSSGDVTAARNAAEKSAADPMETE